MKEASDPQSIEQVIERAVEMDLLVALSPEEA